MDIDLFDCWVTCSHCLLVFYGWVGKRCPDRCCAASQGKAYTDVSGPLAAVQTLNGYNAAEATAKEMTAQLREHHRADLERWGLKW